MPWGKRRALGVWLVWCAVMAGACGGGLLQPEYEYEEELYLDLDGSATLNLNASIASLVALHGLDLPVDPRARVDRERVRALFTPRQGSEAAVSLSRRDGRRFVHVRLEVDDLSQLSAIAPFAWSTYRFLTTPETVEYRQTVGASRGRPVADAGWTGSELVRFRIHVPSEILFHNSRQEIQRGNILEWEQLLAARLSGEPVDLHVQMATESILYTTLLLFGSTIVAAAAAFGLVLWWIVRRGRDADVAETHS